MFEFDLVHLPPTYTSMEVYVDDMITKNVQEVDNVKDLEEAFKVLKLVGMKQNLKKWIFRAKSMRFLGYTIN